ncbi:calcium-binding protein [uncultured Ruegeria sp.]|uniref:calcium-binding protein n=1 Tax=uncultured Ruegeria sp. TaxID=259304 RepID=UPI0026065BA7|nr:calcium-binding protein [uncultured Ruegeria sp.]
MNCPNDNLNSNEIGQAWSDAVVNGESPPPPGAADISQLTDQQLNHLLDYIEGTKSYANSYAYAGENVLALAATLGAGTTVLAGAVLKKPGWATAIGAAVEGAVIGAASGLSGSSNPWLSYLDNYEGQIYDELTNRSFFPSQYNDDPNFNGDVDPETGEYGGDDVSNPNDEDSRRDPSGGGAGCDLHDDAAFLNPLSSPLVIDLDGDGIELTPLSGSQTYFDLNVDGFAERTGWVHSDDGLLAFDVNGNGIIDDNSELFGNMTGFDNGFLQLAELDTNGDGVVDANDAEFAGLTVWRDWDQDGFSDEGELVALSDAEIVAINLNSESISEENQGHVVSDRSTVIFDDGLTGQIDDVHFQNELRDSIALLPEGFQFHPDAEKMPELFGYGKIHSLSVALSLDEHLRTMSVDLLNQLNTGDISSFKDSFKSFVFSWSGVSDVDPTSRGNFIDARHLAFLEKAYGTDFIASGGGSVPGPRGGSDLEVFFDELVEKLAGRFIAQSASSSAHLNSSTFEAYLGEFSSHPFAAFSTLVEQYSSQTRSLEGDLLNVMQVLQQSIFDGNATAKNVYVALGLFQHDLSDGSVDYNQLLFDAAVAAGLTAEDELFAVIEAQGNVEIVAGTDASETISVTEASHIDAGAGNDIVNGSNENDYLHGGAGNDTLKGGRGTDSYVFKEGEGDDIIDETGTTAEGDKLHFGEGITIDDLYSVNTHTGGSGSSLDFTIGLKNGDGTITILDDASNSIYADKQQIQEFVFSDGTTLARNEFRVATMGTDGDDHFEGSGESDDYVFRGGEGNDTIRETTAGTGQNVENDRLVFGEGITVDDLYSISTHTGGDASDHDFTIGLKNGDGTITILDDGDDSIYGDKHQLTEFVFSDGTTLTRNEFRVATMGTDGDDHFDGSGESDDYVFRGGEGNDTIRETIAGTGQNVENDRLVFGEGITVDDLYSINTHTGGDASDHDFTIGLKNGDGTITILDDGDDYIYGNKHHLTEFVFSDGTTMTRNEFRVATMGTAGDDHFDGSGESDDYVFRGGEGNDTIGETTVFSGQQAENDRLVFGADIDQTDVFSFRFDVDNNGVDDLVIGATGMAGSITVLNAYSTVYQSEKYRLDEFVFNDGTALDYDTFLTSTLDQDQANSFFV